MAFNDGQSPALPRETAKQRAARMSMDNYKIRNRMGWLRLLLVIGTPLLALGWWFGGRLVLGDRARQWSSHGKVADAHAQWEFKCEVCHEPFVSATGERSVPFLRGVGDVGQVADSKCISCHKGPPHHQVARSELVVSCGSCHRDHRGRLTSLIDMPDTDCTRCHQDLTAAIQEGEEGKGYHNSITGFDTDHPDFNVRTETTVNGKTRSIVLGYLTSGGFEASSDGRGTPPPTAFGLKFTHSRHMMAGLGMEMDFKRLPAEDRERYGLGHPVEGGSTTAAGLEDLVRLQCADCHSMGDTDTDRQQQAAGKDVPPGGSTGSYYQPIRYEHHCAACHKLTVGSSRKDGEPIAVPHGPQPSELVPYLRRAYAAELLGSDVAIESMPVGSPEAKPDAEAIRRGIEALLSEPEPRPGQGKPPAATIGPALEAVMRQANVALLETRQTCTECHAYEAGGSDGAGPPNVIPTQPPEVWFRHGRFVHSAHRALRCDQCHHDVDGWALADPAAAHRFEPWESAAVLMPSIETCRECHGPAEYKGKHGALSRGGADFDCSECHHYHDGENRFSGVGSLSRGVDEKDRRDVDQFIEGLWPIESSTTGKVARGTSP